MTTISRFRKHSDSRDRAYLRRLFILLLPAAILLSAVGCNRGRHELRSGKAHQYPGMMPEVVVRPIPNDTLPTVLVTASRPGSEPPDTGTRTDISLISAQSKGAVR